MTTPSAPGSPAGASTHSQLACPNCQVELIAHKTSRGIMYYCPRCRGRAVGSAVVRKVLGNTLAYSLWSHAKVAGENQGQKCPSCRQPMTVVITAPRHRQVQLDVCRRCQIAWFDAGEFEDFRIVPANQPAEFSPQAREAMTQAKIDTDARRRAGPPSINDDGPDEQWKWLPAIFGLPVEEDSSIGDLPWLTWGVSAVLIVTFLLTWANLTAAVEHFGLIPAQAWRAGGATLLTSFFIHGSLLHLLGNLYFLVVFGDNVENDIGRWRFAALLLAATLAGDFLHIALDVRPMVPCVGASGGIAGVLAYYALRFPHARIYLFIAGPFYLYRKWLHISAAWAFVLWIAFQVLIAFLQTHAAGDVSGLAHVGGAAAGLAAWALQRYLPGKPAANS